MCVCVRDGDFTLDGDDTEAAVKTFILKVTETVVNKEVIFTFNNTL